MKPKDKCKVCKESDCWEHCQEAADGQHDADPQSAQQAGEVDFTVDYNCKYCGQGGAVAVNPKDIQWD
jgi:hypothetical protein